MYKLESSVLQPHNRKWLIRHTLIVSLASFVAILIGFFWLDLVIALYFKQPELDFVYHYSREVTNIGYSIHYFIAALSGLVFAKYIYPNTLYFKNRITENANKKIFDWSLFLIKSLVFVGLLLQIIKIIFGRQRPHLDPNLYNLNFTPFTFHHHWHSFPSGHAQVVFTVAAVLLLIWPRQKFLFLGVAVFFAFTRVVIHQHFLSDIIGGACIGYLGTLWLLNLWPSRLNTTKNDEEVL
jgi:membrane-associated phospholipid phosphatase